MDIHKFAHTMVGVLSLVRDTMSRSERGLSQSTENAILLAGAVAIATIVIVAITAFVKSNLP